MADAEVDPRPTSAAPEMVVVAVGWFSVMRPIPKSNEVTLELDTCVGVAVGSSTTTVVGTLVDVGEGRSVGVGAGVSVAVGAGTSVAVGTGTSVAAGIGGSSADVSRITT